MTIQTINDYKNKFIISNYSFFTDIFTKPIWGDMGEDTASHHIDSDGKHLAPALHPHPKR